MTASKHQKILNLISAIRDSHDLMTNIFTNGSCMNMFCILRTVYPEARAWYNVQHVITEIDGKFYDITGRILKPEGYKPFSEFYLKKSTISRAFTQMFNYEYDEKRQYEGDFIIQ